MISLHRKIKNKTTIVVDSKEMLNGGEDTIYRFSKRFLYFNGCLLSLRDGHEN